MQSLLTLTLVVFVSTALTDECAPAPGQKMVRAGECCKINSGPDSMKTAFEKCKQKYTMGSPGPRPSGPPQGPPPTPSAEMRLAHACTEECVFSELGLLTSDKKLDKTAVVKFFTTDTALAAVATTAADKCLASYQALIDTSLTCQSGAQEFHHCMKRETFLACPSALWTASTECQDLQARVAKCPKIPIMLGGPPRQ